MAKKPHYKVRSANLTCENKIDFSSPYTSPEDIGRENNVIHTLTIVGEADIAEVLLKTMHSIIGKNNLDMDDTLFDNSPSEERPGIGGSL